uniref:S49 family peptidase n=1 Tax=Escherichia coli TaxID=562 RepID=UPI001F461A9F|nr:S49 family peptidase [Escherichia coli]UGK56406.1 hypothetical protein [Escherichia coli]
MPNPQASPRNTSDHSASRSQADSNAELSKRNTLDVLSAGSGHFISDMENSYKPIIVSVKGICASACYYAVSPADAIYADSSALTGSIGVRMDHWNLSRVMDTVGVKKMSHSPPGSLKMHSTPIIHFLMPPAIFMQKQIPGCNARTIHCGR